MVPLNFSLANSSANTVYRRKSGCRHQLHKLAFGKSLRRSPCNHFADSLANGWIIEHRIEFIGWKRLLRSQERITGRICTSRFVG
jgi:hypothetical protein